MLGNPLLGPCEVNTPEEEEAPRRTQTGRWVVAILAVTALIWGARLYLTSAASVAAADRKAGVKPVLVMFTADWCGPCQSFKAAVLGHDEVVGRVHRSYGFEKVDLTHPGGPSGAAAETYGVRSIPTLMVLNSRRQEIARYRGPHDPAAFAEWLDQYAP